MADYNRARNYYLNHSNADTIRKIQNFLMANGYYDGDLDGLFGPKTFEAIMKYQTDKKLTADGMWGEDTNATASLLNAVDAPYRNDRSGRSGAHKGQEVAGSLRQYKTYGAPMSENALYKRINNLKSKYYSDGGAEWFWSDADDASKWRQLLYQVNGGKDILKEFYDAADDSIRRGISKKALSDDMRVAIQQDRQARGVNNAALPTLAAITSPLLINEPLVLGGAALGSLAGGLAGRNIGALAGRKRVNPETGEYGYDVVGMPDSRSVFGTAASDVTPADEYYSDVLGTEGEVLGGLLGGLAGGNTNYETGFQFKNGGKLYFAKFKNDLIK